MNEMKGFLNFGKEIREIEERYFAFLEDLPVDLVESGNTQFLQRVAEREGKPSIAFYIPFWFAELFDIEDEEAIKEIAMGNFYLYHGATLRDDAFDKKTNNTETYLQLSDITLKKALETYFRLVPEDKNRVFSYLKDLARQWYLAETYLSKHQNTILPYTIKDFEMMGKKAALLKICLPLFCKNRNSAFINAEIATDLAATDTN